MTAKRTRRAGATETIGVSISRETKRKLKTLAAGRHGGNVSALITEMTEDAVRREAFERAWRLYGGPELTDERRAIIYGEFQEGWAHARRYARGRKRRKQAA